MAINRPQGDLVGWGINYKHFQLGKNDCNFFNFLKKNSVLLMPTVGFEPTTSQSLNGSFHT